MARVLIPRVYAILDRAVAGSDGVFLGHLAALLADPHPDSLVWIQLRLKAMDPVARRGLLTEAATLVRQTAVPVLVNGTSGQAVQLGFRGVHWPEVLRPDEPSPLQARLGWVCAAAHDSASLVAAHRAGADAATLSPVYPTASKPGVSLGLEAFRVAASGSPLPVLALGGITPVNAPACIEAGAAGVAVLSSVSAPGVDAPGTVRRLLAAAGPRPEDPNATPVPAEPFGVRAPPIRGRR